jgi:hypothetical protein
MIYFSNYKSLEIHKLIKDVLNKKYTPINKGYSSIKERTFILINIIHDMFFSLTIAALVVVSKIYHYQVNLN